MKMKLWIKIWLLSSLAKLNDDTGDKPRGIYVDGISQKRFKITDRYVVIDNVGSGEHLFVLK